jgi:hypothetical protein
MLWILTDFTSLLIPINGLYRGINSEMDLFVFQGTLLPNTFSEETHDLEKGSGLVDPQTIQITPERTGGWQTTEMKKSTNHGIQTNISEMPQRVETNKEKHQNPNDHPIMA